MQELDSLDSLSGLHITLMSHINTLTVDVMSTQPHGFKKKNPKFFSEKQIHKSQ